MSPATNDFDTSLEFALAHANDPFWEIVYRKRFDHFDRMTNEYHNQWAQNEGFDRTIVEEDGSPIRIEEKLREYDYGDILIEYYSNRKLRTPGWIEKPSLADYLAYAVLESQKCYILHYPTLYQLFKEREDDWWCRAHESMDGFSLVPRDRDDHRLKSLNIAVPLYCLKRQMKVDTIRWR